MDITSDHNSQKTRGNSKRRASSSNNRSRIKGINTQEKESENP